MVSHVQVAIYFWPLLSLCITMGAIWFLLRTGLAEKLALDHPKLQSLHSVAVPCSGGVGVVLAIALTTSLMSGAFATPIGLAVMLSALSWLDDRRNLPIILRLGAHFLAAVLAVLILLPGMSWPIILFLAVLLAWSANLYNFMDGADGLAGGMTFIGFGMLAYAFLVSGYRLEAMACLIIGASGLGFLFFNFHPARIFMGDNGSIPIGFLAGWFGIWGYFHAAWPVSFPILVFFPFLADATLTLLRRVIRGEPFWRAHREHGYQRLIQIGWSHRQVSLAYYLWMLMTGLSGLMVLQVADLGMGIEIILLVSWSIIAMAIIGRVGRLSMDRDIENK